MKPVLQIKMEILTSVYGHEIGLAVTVDGRYTLSLNCGTQKDAVDILQEIVDVCRENGHDLAKAIWQLNQIYNPPKKSPRLPLTNGHNGVKQGGRCS